MELRKHLNPRIVFIGGYFVLFAIYLIIGFQPADATKYQIGASLSIPSIGIETDVANLSTSQGKLDTPSYIAGRYSNAANKTLIIGHYSTVFQNLPDTKIGDKVYYNGHSYTVKRIEIREKPAVSMSKILSSEEKDTIVIMTCAGELYDDGDASHRYMITATIDA